MGSSSSSELSTMGAFAFPLPFPFPFKMVGVDEEATGDESCACITFVEIGREAEQRGKPDEGAREAS